MNIALPGVGADDEDDDEMGGAADLGDDGALPHEDGGPPPGDGGLLADAGIPEEHARAMEDKMLIAEARERQHKQSHLPKNRFCDSFMRGKMKEKYSRRGAFQRALNGWGELITADHVFATTEGCVGCGGLRYGFVIRDVWSRFLQVFPAPKQDHRGGRILCSAVCGRAYSRNRDSVS